MTISHAFRLGPSPRIGLVGLDTYSWKPSDFEALARSLDSDGWDTRRIDLSECSSETDLHRAVRRAITLPTWYSDNLDVLHDCLGWIDDIFTSRRACYVWDFGDSAGWPGVETIFSLCFSVVSNVLQSNSFIMEREPDSPPIELLMLWLAKTSTLRRSTGLRCAEFTIIPHYGWNSIQRDA